MGTVSVIGLKGVNNGMMYNPQLETFLCVVDSGSFSKAADKLFISPPAVIKQINSLESSLELQLFARTHRGLIVTEAGRSLYNDAKYIIGYCKEAVTRAKDSMQITDDVIRVGISPMTPPQVFVELWPKIQQIYPAMKFQLIPFENTPENAREILANLGQNIDVVAGIFDEAMLKFRRCNGIEISKEAFCAAVSIHHRLAKRTRLELQDLYGENVMLMHRGWSHYVDGLRDNLIKDHPQIHIVDFDFYNVEIFNRCENSNDVLLAVKSWESVHPLIKIIPVKWDHTIPFGLLYSKEPSDKVKRLIKAIGIVK
jgi:DNA-binding transcriptional LysR family regulator